MLPHLSLSLRKFKYIRGSPGGMSQCVADIVPATGNFNCAHQAGTRGSYAYVYVAENKSCHICRHSREIGNRSLEHLPISQYPVYQRGISYCSYSTRRNNFVIGVWAISKLSRSCLLLFSDCGSGVVLKGLGCYEFVFIWGSFPNAVKVCHNRNSSIVAIETAIEERAVIGKSLSKI